MAVKSLLKGIILSLLLIAGAACGNAQTPLGNLVSQVRSAVVIVNSYDERGRSLAEGSGFFISPDRVISNLRSIDSARLIRINTFSGKTIFVQSVVARYVDANIAILQLKKGVDAVALKVKIISLDKGAGIVLDNSEETEWRVTPALDGAWSFEHVATHLQVTAGLTETNGRGAVVKLKGHVNGTAVSVP